MQNDPINFFTSLLNSAPVLAAFLFSVYLIGKWFASYMERAEQRDVDREKRYNELVESHINLSNQLVRTTTEALTANTEVLREVKGRLDAGH